MTRDGNDEWVNIYRKQKAHGNSVYHSPNEANPEHMAKNICRWGKPTKISKNWGEARRFLYLEHSNSEKRMSEIRAHLQQVKFTRTEGSTHQIQVTW